jgi:MoaA/NifB/PqqE/SkfB family radical SAM enzyme
VKATITNPTLSNTKREVLHEVVPLSTPFWLCIDPSSLCNITCKYCVQHDIKKDKNLPFVKSMMPISLAKKIIDDLKEFEKPIKVINWYGWGEPLLNKDLPEMIAYSEKQGVTLSNQTITNGILLTNEMSDRLIASGISRINISVQSVTEDGYYEICGKKINLEDYVNNLRYLYEHKSENLTVYIKIGDMALKNADEEKKFFEMFGDICDEIFVEKIINVREDSLANENIPVNKENKSVLGLEAIDRKVCTYLFYRMFICPDGVCALCNADWYRDYIVGDVTKQSVKEIWNGKALKDLQIEHLQGRRFENTMCAKCGNIKYYPSPNDNLDAYTEEILKRF